MILKTNTRGFTLIELLVVIAIIGILASVVLASLNSARDKGSNAALKGALAQVRSQAEIFYDTGRTYTGVCANLSNILVNAQSNSSGGPSAAPTATNAAGTATQVTCHETGTAYAVSAPLKAAETVGGVSHPYYCVDSVGTSKTYAALLGANDVTCD